MQTCKSAIPANADFKKAIVRNPLGLKDPRLDWVPQLGWHLQKRTTPHAHKIFRPIFIDGILMPQGFLNIVWESRSPLFPRSLQNS